MERLMTMAVAAMACLPVLMAASCQSSSSHNPRTVNTTNKEREWHVNFLTARISALQPANGQVQITGRVFNSPDVETHTVPLGHKITFPDHHGRKVYTIAAVRDDGVVIEYDSTFDHRSFGKDLIERDEGTFTLSWTVSAPSSRPVKASNIEFKVQSYWAERRLFLAIIGQDARLAVYWPLPAEITEPYQENIEPGKKQPSVQLFRGGDYPPLGQGGGAQPPSPEGETAVAGQLICRPEKADEPPKPPGGKTVNITIRNLRFPSGQIESIGPLEVQLDIPAMP